MSAKIKTIKSQFIYVVVFFATIAFSCDESKNLKWQAINVEFEVIRDGYLTTEKISEINDNQQRSIYYSNIGEEEKAIFEYDLNCETRNFIEHPIDSILELYNFFPAKESILKLAEETNLVIINEQHHRSSHRKFTTSLLEGLYSRGYRHLGLEALDPNYLNYSLDTAKGFPHFYNGLLLEEASLANLIRSAKSIGFKIFAYEAFSGKGELRETNQAESIQRYIDGVDEKKTLIHCGYNHAREGKLDEYMRESMAEKLKKNLNLDPLTIDQTIFVQRGSSNCERQLYSNYSGEEIATLVPLTDEVSPFKDSDTAYMDIYVFHPRMDNVSADTGQKFEIKILDDYNLIRMYSDSQNIISRIPDKVIFADTFDRYFYIPDNIKFLVVEDDSGNRKLGNIQE